MENRPYYHKLYRDMIREEYPDKEKLCSEYLKKEVWTAIDVIEVNDILFGNERNKEDVAFAQRHRAYDKQSILDILRYQKENELNNNELAEKFRLSRNTLAKWKKLFEKELEIYIYQKIVQKKQKTLVT